MGLQSRVFRTLSISVGLNSPLPLRGNVRFKHSLRLVEERPAWRASVAPFQNTKGDPRLARGGWSCTRVRLPCIPSGPGFLDRQRLALLPHCRLLKGSLNVQRARYRLQPFATSSGQTRRLCPMARCACPLEGKPEASDWPPPEPYGSGLFRQRYSGVLAPTTMKDAAKCDT